MRVLGVDPGLSRCGLGIVDGPRSRPVAVRAGVVRTPANVSVADRLAALHREVTALVAAAGPDVVAVERVFFNANVRTAMGVGQAAGVVLLAAAQAGVPVVEYTPTQVKAVVTGDGAADKAQVAYMVAAVLRLAERPSPPDAADALALALCHLQQTAAGAGGQGSGSAAAGASADSSAPSGGMAPRLAAAVAAAGPGAQVSQRGAAARRGAEPAHGPGHAGAAATGGGAHGAPQGDNGATGQGERAGGRP